MNIKSITAFNGRIEKLVDGEDDNSYNDKFIYGFMATDEQGNRVDPKTIRMKQDGSYVIVEFE